jgi:hypothetical protein
MHRLCALVAAGIALWTVGGGCNNNLPSASLVDKLRVLAVRAEPPELAPGEETALSLLAVEPHVPMAGAPAPAPLTAYWIACALPTGQASVLPCGVGAGSTPPTDLGDGLSSRYRVPDDLLAGGASATVLITVAVADTEAGAQQCVADIIANNGLPTDPDHCVISLKRLQVSDPAQRTVAPNANPLLAAFTVRSEAAVDQQLEDGTATWTVPAKHDADEWQPIAERQKGSAEKKADGTYEALSVSWFTTAGHVDGGRSIYLPEGCNDPAACADQEPELFATTSWYSPTDSEAAGRVADDGVVTFWAVLRDDRGGVGWKTGTFTRR